MVTSVLVPQPSLIPPDNPLRKCLWSTGEHERVEKPPPAAFVPALHTVADGISCGVSNPRTSQRRSWKFRCGQFIFVLHVWCVTEQLESPHWCSNNAVNLSCQCVWMQIYTPAWSSLLPSPLKTRQEAPAPGCICLRPIPARKRRNFKWHQIFLTHAYVWNQRVSDWFLCLRSLDRSSGQHLEVLASNGCWWKSPAGWR